MYHQIRYVCAEKGIESFVLVKMSIRFVETLRWRARLPSRRHSRRCCRRRRCLPLRQWWHFPTRSAIGGGVVGGLGVGDVGHSADWRTGAVLGAARSEAWHTVASAVASAVAGALAFAGQRDSFAAVGVRVLPSSSSG